MNAERISPTLVSSLASKYLEHKWAMTFPLGLAKTKQPGFFFVSPFVLLLILCL